MNIEERAEAIETQASIPWELLFSFLEKLFDKSAERRAARGKPPIKGKRLARMMKRERFAKSLIATKLNETPTINVTSEKVDALYEQAKDMSAKDWDELQLSVGVV